MNLLTKSLLTAASVVALIAQPTDAAIVVTSSDDILQSGSSNFTITSAALPSFNPVGAAKLVLALVYEQNVNASSMSYNGDPMTQIAFNNNAWGNAQLWHIDASSATGGAFSAGNLTLTVTGETEVAVSIMSLTGTADGFVAKEDLSERSINFVPGAENALVVASMYNAADSQIATAPSGSTSLMSGATGGGGGYAYGAAYWENQPATATTYSFNGNSRNSMAIASFEAVPEPGTLALMDLGGLMLVGLWRRRR